MPISKRTKVLAVVYVIILAIIVYLADRRDTQFLFRPIRNLPYGDKFGHFFLMGFFSFAVNLILSAKTFRVWKISYLTGSVIVLIIVTIEECSQLFIRGRSFDLTDMVANICGIIIFGELARLVCNRLDKKKSKTD